MFKYQRLCSPVPVHRRDDSGDGLRRDRLPGPIAEDQTTARLSPATRYLGAAGVPRPRSVAASYRAMT